MKWPGKKKTEFIHYLVRISAGRAGGGHQLTHERLNRTLRKFLGFLENHPNKKGRQFFISENVKVVKEKSITVLYVTLQGIILAIITNHSNIFKIAVIIWNVQQGRWLAYKSLSTISQQMSKIDESRNIEYYLET